MFAIFFFLQTHIFHTFIKRIARKYINFEREIYPQMKEKRIFLPFLLLAFTCLGIKAQESTSVFNFLNLPSSSHATALGGRNISLIEDDISLTFQNPALLSSVSDKTLGLNFMSYMKGSKAGSASYAQVVGANGTWGVNVQFLGYGKMQETSPSGEILGDMHALDMCWSGLYSHNLGARWVGGASGKFIYSHLGGYSSMALAVDLGLSYFKEETDFSLAFVARNMGGQVKAFADHHERLPFGLEIGMTKGLGHAPISISLTLVDLTRWDKDYYYSPDKKISGGKLFMNHINIGVDIHPSHIFYVSAGYNFRRASEMKAAGSSHGAGLTFGAGINLNRIKVGMAYGKYHIGAPTFAVSLAYSLTK